MQVFAWTHRNVGAVDLERAVAARAGAGRVHVHPVGGSAFWIEATRDRIVADVVPALVALSGTAAHQVTVPRDDGPGEVLSRGGPCPGRCTRCHPTG